VICGVTGLVALILTAVALPPLLARLTGGRPPRPRPHLAALAPAAVVPAVAAVAVAAASSGVGWGGGWGLALLLAIPAAILLAWQLPSRRRPSRPAATPSGPGPTVRLLTLNARGGSADPAALLSRVRELQVDVLSVQELTPEMAGLLDQAGLARMLPYAHLDPRPDSPGAGLWARWPLTPLPPVLGMTAAAPRARAEPAPGWQVTLTTVHPIAPSCSRAFPWQRDLTRLQALAGTEGRQIVMGDFNASRDHLAFRDLLAAGFTDCADSAQRRTWPGFTWPTSLDFYSNREKMGFPDWRAPRIMRLDHVLVTRTGTTVHEARPVRASGTDHHAVLAVIEFG
jgi:endonuclease/exonuclease/phosphatase (EEP) superfamily protein YafD